LTWFWFRVPVSDALCCNPWIDATVDKITALVTATPALALIRSLHFLIHITLYEILNGQNIHGSADTIHHHKEYNEFQKYAIQKLFTQKYSRK
jgi:hypothetical protein